MLSDKKILTTIKRFFKKNPLTLTSLNKKGEAHYINIDQAILNAAKNEIIIRDSYMQKTLKNILQNPKVTLNVWGEDADKEHEYEFSGTAHYYNKGSIYNTYCKRFEKKGIPCKGVIILKIENIKELK
ncbi:MAG: hypothetical protein GF347_00325 [Candidatus Moranbacteria bacterium]|nr:hypothetical protein [Candidatus Moranbacteria bacterium]